MKFPKSYSLYYILLLLRPLTIILREGPPTPVCPQVAIVLCLILTFVVAVLQEETALDRCLEVAEMRAGGKEVYPW